MKYVVFDVDGVLADFVLGFTILARQKFNLEWPAWRSNGAQFAWDFDEFTKDQLRELWDDVRASASFWESLHPVASPGDIASIGKLTDISAAPLYMTTRSGKQVVEQTESWLSTNHFFPGPVCVVSDKVTGIKDAFKGAHPRDVVLAVLEDKPAELEALRDAGLPVYARDWPYNREVDGVPRVGSIAEFVRVVVETERDHRPG